MTITYRKGSLSNNADSLSRRPAPVAATTFTSELPDLLQHQGKDPIIRQLRESLQSLSPPHGPAWRHPSFCHYRQIWSQLTLQNGLVCRQYAPSPTSDTVWSQSFLFHCVPCSSSNTTMPQVQTRLLVRSASLLTGWACCMTSRHIVNNVPSARVQSSQRLPRHHCRMLPLAALGKWWLLTSCKSCFRIIIINTYWSSKTTLQSGLRRFPSKIKLQTESQRS